MTPGEANLIEEIAGSKLMYNEEYVEYLKAEFAGKRKPVDYLTFALDLEEEQGAINCLFGHMVEAPI